MFDGELLADDPHGRVSVGQAALAIDAPMPVAHIAAGVDAPFRPQSEEAIELGRVAPATLHEAQHAGRCSAVSNETRASPARGGRTRSLATWLSPAPANSSSSGGKSAAVRLRRASRAMLAMLSTNAPVASALLSESLRPTETKPTTGGSVEKTVVYECGARFGTPSTDSVDTQATGRGAIAAFSRWYIAPLPNATGRS
jgi:hypothetical protein